MTERNYPIEDHELPEFFQRLLEEGEAFEPEPAPPSPTQTALIAGFIGFFVGFLAALGVASMGGAFQ